MPVQATCTADKAVRRLLMQASSALTSAELFSDHTVKPSLPETIEQSSRLCVHCMACSDD